MTDLLSPLRPERKTIRPGVDLLPGFCRTAEFLPALTEILDAAPFRHMATPGGRRMSVAITNCGDAGWISDAKGYRYSRRDPATGAAWPAMPAVFQALARDAAEKCGYGDFRPDSCLINRYRAGASLGAHQDRDEENYAWPIVSVSLGRAALFQYYGESRGGRAINIRLDDGDVMVMGGPARLAFHGVRRLLPEGMSDGAAGMPAPLRDSRINLTFRRALS